MSEVKALFASKTVWGGIIALLAGIAGLFGYGLDQQDQMSLVEGITSILSSVGGVIAIVGRLLATKRITE